MCFTTDPFMYKQPEVVNLSLKIIAKLNKNKIRVTVLTKGLYPKDLLNSKKFSSDNEYGITLVSLNEIFKSKFEPNSAPFIERIKKLKELHDAGLKTWVSMEPYPTPNIIKQDLLETLSQISFVDKIIFGKLNYNTNSSLFKHSKEFYDSCAETVVSFCRTKEIEYHIKFGTYSRTKVLEEDKKTEEIFADNRVKKSPYISPQVSLAI